MKDEHFRNIGEGEPAKVRSNPFGRPKDVDDETLKLARTRGLEATTTVPDFEGYLTVSQGILETKEWICPRCGRLNPCAVDCVQCQAPRIKGNWDVHQEGVLGENRDAASLNHIIIDTQSLEGDS